MVGSLVRPVLLDPQPPGSCSPMPVVEQSGASAMGADAVGSLSALKWGRARPVAEGRPTILQEVDRSAQQRHSSRHPLNFGAHLIWQRNAASTLRMMREGVQPPTQIAPWEQPRRTPFVRAVMRRGGPGGHWASEPAATKREEVFEEATAASSLRELRQLLSFVEHR